MFSLSKYSNKPLNEDLEDVLGKLESTDVLIVNTGFNLSNYEEILSVMLEKLNDNSLLVIQLDNHQLVNDKVKNSLNTRDKLKVDMVEFTSHKLSNDEFILAEKVNNPDNITV